MMMRGYPDSGFLNISSLSWRAHYTVPYCYVSTVSGNSAYVWRLGGCTQAVSVSLSAKHQPAVIRLFRQSDTQLHTATHQHPELVCKVVTHATQDT